MKLPNILKTVCILSTGILILVFSWWHWKFALIRYFDADEFAHLHWASQIVMGRRPYIDFFSFFPPGFWLILTPLFRFGWGTSTPIILARISMFFIFIGTLTCIGLLFFKMRRSLAGLFAALFFAFLPLPMDKIIEIRPDNLVTFLTLIVILLQIEGTRKRSKKYLLIVGCISGLILITLTKAAPTILLSFVILWFSAKTLIRSYVIGLSVPLSLFGFWSVFSGHFSTIWYSLVVLPLEANKLGEIFFMGPDLFFYPNNIYYGQGGINAGLLVNHAIWLFGLGVGTYRLLMFSKEELLVAGIFLLNVILYVLYVPLKHAQYLIPISVFVAFYAADGFLLLWQHMKRRNTYRIIAIAGYIFTLHFLYKTFLLVNYPKLSWTNTESVKSLETLWKTIPQNEYVFDLEGRTLYYKDPYYVCCLPFGQYAHFLSRPLPNLIISLEETKTQYIYQGPLERVTTLPANDLTYIRKYYQTSILGGELFVRK